MSRFTPGELECMQVLWEHGELKPAEIQERLPREVKNPALRSYLTILLEKGHVTRRKVGKAYHYKAKTRQDRAFRSMVRELASTFCGGSTRQLVANLVKAEKLSPKDIEELKRAALGDEDALSEGDES